MTDEEYLLQVKALLKKAYDLVSDPHPGLSSWCMAYGTAMQQISDLWNKGSKTEE